MTRSIAAAIALVTALGWAEARGDGPNWHAELGAIAQEIEAARYAEALTQAGRVAAMVPVGDRHVQSALLTLRARALSDLGRLREAAAALDGALAQLVGTADAEQVVAILVETGEVRWRQGESAEARRAFDEAAGWSEALAPGRRAPVLERARARLAAFFHRYDEAIERYRAARDACETEPDRVLCETEADLGLADVSLRSGDAPTARRLFAAALPRLSRRDLPRERAIALAGLAAAHRELGERELATAHCEAALTLARDSQHRPLLAELQVLRGELALDAGDTGAATTLLDAALAQYRAMRSAPGVAASRAILARLSLRRARPREAAIHARAARAIYEQLGDGDGIVSASALLAEIAAALGDGAGEQEAVDAILAQRPTPRLRHDALVRASRLARHRGDVERAMTLLEDAGEALDQVPVWRLDARERDALARARAETYDALIDVILSEEAGANAAHHALRASERGVSRAFADVLERARLRRESPETAELLAELDAVEREDRRAARAESEPDTGALAALAGRRNRLEFALLGLAPRWLAPRGADAERRISRGLARVTAGLRDDVVILKYHLADPRSWLFVIDRVGVSVFELPSRTELGRDVRAFGAAIAKPGGSPRAIARLGSRLYSKLMAPARARLGGRTRLVIVPHRELRLLPFDALTLPAGAASTAERALAARNHTPLYLVYRYVVTYAPSVAVVDDLHREATRRQGLSRYPLVAFADPRYDGRRVSLPRLSASRGEVEAASASLRAGDPTGTLFLGEEASEERLKKLDLSRYRVVHLAAHGYAPDEIGGDEQPALFFARRGGEDGVLELSEVLDLNLDADLVVLSACSSARGKLEPGDGLGALTHAFLYAGSSAVLATLWAVEDDHAARMMAGFYRELGEARPSAEALRDARLGLLAGISEPGGRLVSRGIGGITEGGHERRPAPAMRRAARSADPFFWASYVLVGESGDILRY